jgi:alkylated DNA repair dioxygenase AlkB
VKEMLVRALQVDDTYLPHDSVLRQLPISFRSLISVELIQDGKSDCNDRDEDSSNKAIVPSNANANAGSDCANGSTTKKQKGRTNHVAITKARIQYPSAKVARAVVAFIRHQKISPSILFPQFHQGGDSAVHPYVYVYSTKHIQATQVTQIPLPPPTLAWPRVGMPKFRRLLLNSHDTGDAIQKIKYERSHTRFVFMTNIIDYSLSSKAESEPIHVLGNSGNRNVDVDAATAGDRVDVSSDIIERLRTEPYLFQDAIRNAIAPYLVDLGLEADVDGNADAKMLPPEVFVPSKKQQSPFKYCYIGTRSAQHAQALIRDLQGKKITLAIARGDINNKQSDDAIIVTGKLFLDFVDITQRSAAKSNRLNPSSVLPGFDDQIDIKGGPPKPECTSTTNSIVVQGLHCLADFVTPQEEQVLLACLTGPHAPWAPSQKNFSKTGSVKRRVQHYGYVFDYETADVLRDRDTTATTDDGSKSNALCPPMPVLPDGSEAWSDTQMNEFVSEAVRDGNGWDVVAAVIERVRRHDFNLAIGSNVDGEINDANADTIKEIVNTAENHTSVNLKSEFVSDIDKRNAALPSDASKCYPNINQMTVNEYKRGQGIGSHIDTKSAFDDGLISLSLGSDCVMEFRNEKNPKEKKLVHLPPRSLLLMSGPARYSWAHQIVTRMTDSVDGKVIPRKTRVSLTLRTAITLPCQGDDGVKPLEKVESRDYPPKWGKLNGNAKDSNNSDDMDGNPDDDIATPETEKNHVQAVYDAIATQWHHTRGKRGVLWP